MLTESDFLSRRAKLAQGLAQGPAAALKTAEDMTKSEELLEPSLEFLESWLRDLVVLQHGAGGRLYNGDLAELATRAAAAERSRQRQVLRLVRMEASRRRA